MARNITTVTHADGTVSRRTSASAIYAFAVEVKRDRRHEALCLRESADAADARAARFDALAETGAVTETRKPWAFGGEYVTLYVGGEFATSFVSDRDERPSDEDARAKVRAYADGARKHAATLRDRAATLDAGPEFTYGIYRWSRTAALAEKGLREVVLHGRGEARVVPVD
jgi:hypothetical protein